MGGELAACVGSVSSAGCLRVFFFFFFFFSLFSFAAASSLNPYLHPLSA